MAFLGELWVPILVSAVMVFIVSSVIHMLLPIHKKDCAKLPDEGRVLEALRGLGLAPGMYMFPHAGSMKECGSPEMLEKFRQGPVGTMIVRPKGMPKIGTALLQWFLFSVVVGVFVAYIAAHTVQPGAGYDVVFRITGTIATLAYGLSNVTDSIWKGVPWSTTFKFVFDGLVYGLVTGGTFGWLWPAAH